MGWLSLEKRLAVCETPELVEECQNSLESRDYGVPHRMGHMQPYHKYYIPDRIREYLGSNAPSESFFRNVLSKVNWQELKRSYYGMCCLGKRYPTEVVGQLNDWEKLYVHWGIWWSRAPMHEQSVTDVTWRLIKDGIDRTHKEHQIKLAKKKYRRPLKLPFSQYYHLDRKPEPSDTIAWSVAEIENMLLRELKGPSEDLGEAIALRLDGCSDVQLRYLTKKYGSRLGGYRID